MFDVSERRPSHHIAVFRPIAGSRSMLEVADQITFSIVSGCYRPGEFLPTVEDLAEAMRVSRPTIGEAVRLLADEGVVEPRRGAHGGILVLTSTIPPKLMKLSRRRRGRTLAELVEARRPIEMALVELAAVRASQQDLEQLEAANAFLVASIDRQREWVQANNLFHAIIGRAAGNELLAYFQHEIHEELALLLDDYGEQMHADRERTVREHEETLAVLRTREPAAAVKVMDRHLREWEELAPSHNLDAVSEET